MKTHGDLNPGPFVLASVLTGYPDQDYVPAIAQLLEDDDLKLPEDLQKTLSDMIINPQYVIDDLSSEYLAIFDVSKHVNPLYETEYGRERAMFKTNELADIAGFYRAFGFEMDSEGLREMIDHISVELEFYSLMIMKQIYLKSQGQTEGVEIVNDGMSKFMNDHLGRFVSSILQRPGVIDSTYYSQVFRFVQQLISQECERLGVTPEQTRWLASQAEPEEVCCAVATPQG